MRRRFVTLVMVIGLVVSSIASSQIAPAAAQSDPVIWYAEYFDNEYLLGDPVATAQYSALDLNWGASAPVPEVGADAFTARFATDVWFEAGTYRFFILADDAIQLFVDFPPLSPLEISTFDDPRPGELITADVTLDGGFHHLQVDFRERTGDAYLFVSWGNVLDNPEPPAFQAPVAVGQGAWTAQYYANSSLAGTPTVTQTDTTVTHDWGLNAPLPGLPVDNFSVRWTSVQSLTGGTYEIRVQADDGVRVYVNGALVIDEFQLAQAQTFSHTVNLSAGIHNFTVEYVEFNGDAFINFQLLLVGGTTTPLPITGPSAMVLAGRLNVRDAPSVSTGNVITQVSRGETYPIVGRSTDGSWYQLNVNGLVGWASGAYLSVDNETAGPVTDAANPVATGYTATARANLNVRRGPGLQFARFSTLPSGESAEIVGRNADSTWWHIRIGDELGWVSAYYADVSPGIDASRIPVTG